MSSFEAARARVRRRLAMPLALAMLATTIVGAGATSAAAASQYRRVHVVFDSKAENELGQSGCDGDPDTATDFSCRGNFTGDDATAPFVDGADGKVTGHRDDDTDKLTLTFTLPGGEIRGVVRKKERDAFDVTSGLADWTSGMDTPNHEDAEPGEKGAPLALEVLDRCASPTDCDATFAISGYVLADAPAQLSIEPGPDQDWVQFDAYLDSPAKFLQPSTGCTGPYYQGRIYEPRREKIPFLCNGEWQGHRGTLQTTWPFNGGSGTARGSGAVFGNVNTGHLQFFVTGAEFDGHMQLQQVTGVKSDRYVLTSMKVPWAKDAHSGDSRDIAAGEQGGPLYFDAAVPRDYDESLRHSMTISIHGWLLRTKN